MKSWPLVAEKQTRGCCCRGCVLGAECRFVLGLERLELVDLGGDDGFVGLRSLQLPHHVALRVDLRANLRLRHSTTAGVRKYGELHERRCTANSAVHATLHHTHAKRNPSSVILPPTGTFREKNHSDTSDALLWLAAGIEGQHLGELVLVLLHVLGKELKGAEAVGDGVLDVLGQLSVRLVEAVGLEDRVPAKVQRAARRNNLQRKAK